MPITRRQFELEIDAKIEEWMRKIHSFLNTHAEEAFTEAELHEALDPSWLVDLQKKDRQQGFLSLEESSTRKSEERAFDLALEKLVELGAVGKATIRASEYYAYRRELEDFL